MDYCSLTLSLGEYSSRTPRPSGSEKALSSAHFYGPFMVKEFYLRVNIHPALFTAVVSCRVDPQIQGWVEVGISRLSFTAEKHPCGIFGDACQCSQEAIEVAYPQIFEKWGEKFKKYEHISLCTDNLLSFNSF